MIRLLGRLWRSPFTIRREEWTPDDVANRDSFVTSVLCGSIEKSIRNRIAARNDEVLENAGKIEGSLARARMKELEDILLEWKNLREDLQKR